MEKLSLIHKFFERLHHDNISYCNWKSNEHLGAAVKGDTDLDILFDITYRDKLEVIFKELGFKLYKAPWFRSYPYIYDYIGIDYRDNKVIHVHTHYKLILGERGIKNHHLKLEKRLLDKRIFNKEYETYTCPPDYEMFLLLIRIGLKFGKSYKWDFESNNSEIRNLIVEFNWLRERADFESTKNILINEVGTTIIPLLETIWNKGLINKNVRNLCRIVKTSLKKDERFRFSYYLIIIIRMLAFQISRVLRKTGLFYIPKKRISSGAGFTIALIGSDGSGKSTQIKILSDILNNKIDVENFYLGSNKGHRSTLRKTIETLDAKINRNEDVLGGNSSKTFIQRLSTMLAALSVAQEKKNKINKAARLRRKGVFVICDRFPQTTLPGYNDGPLLYNKYSSSKNIFIRGISNFELRCYSVQKKQAPDIIFKLIADPLSLMERRNMTLDQVTNKQEGIRSLKFNKISKIVEIDADLSIKGVTSDILKHIYLEYFKRN